MTTQSSENQAVEHQALHNHINEMIHSSVVVDVETTGLNSASDRIIEIGAARIKDGIITDQFQEYVNPNISLPYFITTLTGINDQDLADASPIQEILPNFCEFVGNSPLVAHNLVFDTSFLNAGIDMTNHSKASFLLEPPLEHFAVSHGLCTLKSARTLLTREDVGRYSLVSLAQYFQINSRPTHRALDDVRATVELLKNLQSSGISKSS